MYVINVCICNEFRVIILERGPEKFQLLILYVDKTMIQNLNDYQK